MLLLFGLAFLSSVSAGQSATQLDGKPLNPLSGTSGKVVVLIFLRTDCPVSNRYAPTLQRISTQFQQQAQFYLVFPNKSESVLTIRNYVNSFSYKLPALRDGEHSLVKQAHAQITPEAAVFDKRGKLAYHGRIDNLYEDFTRARTAPTTHELEDAIQAVLKGSQPMTPETTAVGCYISDIE
jgi:thiol-disulfide isomerase/thioredoxin